MKKKTEEIRHFYQSVLKITDSVLLDRVTEHTEYKRIPAGELIVKAGEKPIDFFFLVSGIFRGFFIDADGQEITDCFGFKSGIPILSTFQFDVSSPVSIEAIEDCEVLRIPTQEIMQILQESPSAVRVYNDLLQEALNKQWETKQALYQYSAMQKYEWFMETYAEIANRVTGKNIASFLNITPVTLSRLRRKIREEGEKRETEHKE